MQRTYPNDRIVSGKVKGGGVRVRVKGSIDEGEIISQEERFDFKISKYFPIVFYLVDFGNRKMEFIKSELTWLNEV